MPNKFSHSVVLAHYHSLGLIDLPNGQYLVHLISSPPASHRTPGTPFNTQAARNKAADADDIDEGARQRSGPGQASQVPAPANLAESPQIPKPRVIIDTDDVSEDDFTAIQSSLHEKASSTSMSRTNSRSVQKDSKPYSIQPAYASKSDSREAVNGEWASQAIRTESLASLKTSAALHSDVVRERLRNRPQPVADRAADADGYKHAPNSRSQNLRPTHPTQAPQTAKSPRLRSSSTVDSAIAKPLSPGMVSLAVQPSRHALAYQDESHIFNPLPEVADFDGFDDVEEPDENGRTAINKSSSTLKAGSGGLSGLRSEAELVPRLKDASTYWPDRSSSITGSQAPTSEPASPYIQDFSACGSLDSLSSLSSINIPVVERAHPLRQDKRVASQTIRPSGKPSQSPATNSGNEARYGSSLAEPRYLPRRNSGARQPEHGHRGLVLRQPVQKDQGREIHAARRVEPGIDSLSDLTMYGVRNAVGSPLAQVEKMLQKREDESNTRDGIVNNGIGLRREEKVKEAEKRLMELKKNKADSRTIVDSHKQTDAKLRRREAGGFFHRLREQI